MIVPAAIMIPITDPLNHLQPSRSSASALEANPNINQPLHSNDAERRRRKRTFEECFEPRVKELERATELFERDQDQLRTRTQDISDLDQVS